MTFILSKFLEKPILQAAYFVEIGRFFCGFLYAAPAIETWEGQLESKLFKN
jgi:hypothetical protein